MKSLVIAALLAVAAAVSSAKDLPQCISGPVVLNGEQGTTQNVDLSAKFRQEELLGVLCNQDTSAITFSGEAPSWTTRDGAPADAAFGKWVVGAAGVVSFASDVDAPEGRSKVAVNVACSADAAAEAVCVTTVHAIVYRAVPPHTTAAPPQPPVPSTGSPPTEAPPQSAAPPATTLQPASTPSPRSVWADLGPCTAVYGFDVPLNTQFRGSLEGFSLATSCDAAMLGATTYVLAFSPNASTSNFILDQDGTFHYGSSPRPNQDRFGFFIACGGVPTCQAIAYLVISDVELAAPTLPPAPTAPPVQVDDCSRAAYNYQVHYKFATPGATHGAIQPVTVRLGDRAGERECFEYESFTILAGPYASGASAAVIDTDGGAVKGDVSYVPPAKSQWDNFTFVIRCKKAVNSSADLLGNYYHPKRNVWACKGQAHLLSLPPYIPTQPPPTTASPVRTPAPPEWLVSNGAIRCKGSCSGDAWKAMHFYPDMWDTTFDETGSGGYSHVRPRRDGRPLDQIDAAILPDGSGLSIAAYATVGNVAARFPTFEPIPAYYLITNPNFDGAHAARTRLSADSIADAVSISSLPFETTCLNRQPFFGAGEQVWWWTNITAKEGGNGFGYNKWRNYYQKFGGKHESCDIFNDAEQACRFAPMLTPRAGPKDEAPRWTLDVDSCDTKWVGRFAADELWTQTINCGPTGTSDDASSKCWAWQRVPEGADGRRMDLVGTLYSEGVKPTSWVHPAKGFMTDDRATTVRARFQETVEVTPAAKTNNLVFAGATRQASLAVSDAASDSNNNNDDGTLTFSYALTFLPNTDNGVAADGAFLPPAIASVDLIDEAFDAINADVCAPYCGSQKLKTRLEAPVLSCEGGFVRPATDAPPSIEGNLGLLDNGTTTAAPPTTAVPATTAAPGAPTLCYDVADSLLLRASLGPSATRRCPLTKPYLPIGVAGVGDAATCADSEGSGAFIARRDRGVNVTIRLTVQKKKPQVASSPNTTTARTIAAPFFPRGKVGFAIRYADGATERHTLSVGAVLESVSSKPAVAAATNDDAAASSSASSNTNAYARQEAVPTASMSLCVARPSQRFPLRYDPSLVPEATLAAEGVLETPRDSVSDVCVSDATDGGQSAAPKDSAPSVVGAADRVVVAVEKLASLSAVAEKAVAAFAKDVTAPVVDEKTGEVIEAAASRRRALAARRQQQTEGGEQQGGLPATAAQTDESFDVHRIAVTRKSDGVTFVLFGKVNANAAVNNSEGSSEEFLATDFAPDANVQLRDGGRLAFTAGSLCSGTQVRCELELSALAHFKTPVPGAVLTAPMAADEQPAEAFRSTVVTIRRSLVVDLAVTPYVQAGISPRSLPLIPKPGMVVPASPPRPPVASNAPVPPPPKPTAPAVTEPTATTAVPSDVSRVATTNAPSAAAGSGDATAAPGIVDSPPTSTTAKPLSPEEAAKKESTSNTLAIAVVLVLLVLGYLAYHVQKDDSSSSDHPPPPPPKKKPNDDANDNDNDREMHAVAAKKAGGEKSIDGLGDNNDDDTGAGAKKGGNTTSASAAKKKAPTPAAVSPRAAVEPTPQSPPSPKKKEEEPVATHAPPPPPPPASHEEEAKRQQQDDDEDGAKDEPQEASADEPPRREEAANDDEDHHSNDGSRDGSRGGGRGRGGGRRRNRGRGNNNR